MSRHGSRKSKPSSARSEPQGTTLPTRPGGPAAPATAWLLAGIVVAGVLVYLNSFSAAFVFDCQSQIVEEEDIRSFRAIGGRRPVVDFTLALNYAVGELDVFGYHLVNLIIHLLAGLTLFGVIHRTLRLEPMRTHFGRGARWIAFCVGLIWVVHPLQTGSVTYVIQRAESLACLFYLLTLYCTIRGATTHERVSSRFLPRVWYVAAIVACGLGMGSKAITVTAPVLVLLYDRVFLAPSFVACLRRRWALHAGLAATLLVLVSNGVAEAVLLPGDRVKTVGFGYRGVTALEYALSQPGVILHYLKLSLWPVPLCLDYAWPVARSTFAIVAPGVVLAGLLVATAWSLWKRPRIGFVAAGFFIVLAPTSSFIPIKDLAFEHRMYLPLAAVILLVVLGVRAIMIILVTRGALEARAVPGVVGVLLTTVTVLCAAGTIDRNRDYDSALGMWEDIIEKRPLNARAHSNYGVMLVKAKRYAEARPHLERSIELDPDDGVAHNNLAFALLDAGEDAAAIDHMVLSIMIRPEGSAKGNLANLLARAGNIDDTISRYSRRVALDDVQVDAWMIRGDLHLREGRRPDAIAAYERAIALDPEHEETRRRLEVLANQR